MSDIEFRRPGDEQYYETPWSDGVLQGDIFRDVPIGIPTPADALLVEEGERRFITGPFDSGPVMLLSPSCAIAAQGRTAPVGAYAHPARTVVPLRPLEELLAAGALTEQNVAGARRDRLKNYLYLPASEFLPESVALLYMPLSVHHDLIAENRVAQLSGVAHRHLKVKLMWFWSGVLLDHDELGEPEAATDRTS